MTVFIPTYNGGELFEEVLEAITTQETPFPFELFCIDSGSRDGTLDRLRRFQARVIQIPHGEFDHGLTRNQAIREARGRVVLLTVQDATPVGAHWITGMVEHFEDPQVAGVYCHQVPRPDCNPFVRERLKDWVPEGAQPEVRQVKNAEAFWRELDHIQRWRTIAFDNVASAVRTEVARRLPFPKRRFGEDVTWAKGAILAGYKIVMDPRVAVVHSHNHSIWYEFKRAYLDHQNVNSLVGLRLAPKLRNVLEYTAAQSRHLFRAVWRDRRLPPAQRLWWCTKVIPFCLTQNLGQYLGPLSNLQGRSGLWRLWDRIVERGV